MRESLRRARAPITPRAARARLRPLALGAALGAAGCSSLLGIDDPVPDFGGDGGPRSLASLAIGPSPLSFPLGVTRQLRAIGTFSDGSTDDLTSQVEFSLLDGNTLTVSPTGQVTAIAQGESRVKVALGRIAGDAVATVGAAVAERVTFSIGDFTVARQQRVRLRAIAAMTDGTMEDVTATATLSSTNTAIAATGPGRVDAGTTAGTATISASVPGATPGTVRVTVEARDCHPVINELQTGTAADAGNEWVEILNPCTGAFDVTGWTLAYRASSATGGTDTALLATLAGSLAAGDLRLYAGDGYGGTKDGGWTGASGQLQQSSAAVGLRSGPLTTGPLVDAVAYGAVLAGHPFIEGTAASAMVNDKALQRRPFDGNDRNQNNNDLVVVDTATPRQPNVP